MIVECHSSFSDPGATASDNCSGNLTSQITVQGNVNAAVPGTYTLIYSVTDAAGNLASKTRTVNVIDTVPPVLTLVGANPLTVECHTGFSDPGAAATDDCDGDLGSKIVVIHPPFLWELKYQAWLLGELDHYSTARGVDIAVENMFHLWVRGKAIRGHRWLSPSDLEGFPRVTLDTSHCGVDGTDILAALDQVGPRIAHVHLSDSRGDHRDNHALPGSGILPLERFVSRLPEIGYDATVSLELDLRELIPEPDRCGEALIRAREFCLERLA